MHERIQFLERRARESVPTYGLPSFNELADDDLIDELRIVSWTQVLDIPHAWELNALGFALSDEQEELLRVAPLPHDGDKLLGWPAWQQNVEQHRCPRCSAVMRPIFQIDSCKGVPVMLGDGGRGWIIQCPEHTDIVSFHWTS